MAGGHQAMLFGGGQPEISLVSQDAQAQTGTVLYWVPPTHQAGDLCVGIFWADGANYPYWDADGGYQDPTEETTYTQSTVLRSVTYSFIGDGGSTDLATQTASSVRTHCHWYVFRNATGVDCSTASTHVSLQPDPPSYTATSGYSKYYWIAVAATSGSYTASSAPTNYSDLAGYGNSAVSSWTAWRSTTSNTENPGTFGANMPTGLTATIAVY